jgi:hypothetical protein
MTNVRTLSGTVVEKQTVADFLNEQRLESAKYNKAIVILVNDDTGEWETKWSVLGLSPTETNFALDLVKTTNMDTMRR